MYARIKPRTSTPTCDAQRRRRGMQSYVVARVGPLALLRGLSRPRVEPVDKLLMQLSIRDKARQCVRRRTVLYREPSSARVRCIGGKTETRHIPSRNVQRRTLSTRGRFSCVLRCFTQQLNLLHEALLKLVRQQYVQPRQDAGIRCYSSVYFCVSMPRTPLKESLVDALVVAYPHATPQLLLCKLGVEDRVG
ncbi:hypothetical protein GLX27_002124 [Malassezia furfur]|uniref:Uncharacterized protein n=1 Tax=Malassezia furfur TaxID=55194 RepID=A0ABY8EPN4_MALFU|nr:hypothetical protein GLX27_002124 [Malassezia furfur]